MKTLTVLLAALAICAAPASALGEAISGDFNTGPSPEKETVGASLNIRFHPCADEPELTCATVLEAVEPNGPSGRTILPNGDPIVGFVVVKGLKPEGDGKFRDGKIAALDQSMIKGKMIWYGLKVDDNFDGTLAATGCLGFICPRKMVWTAVGATAGGEQ
jgi:hypothetical protein